MLWSRLEMTRPEAPTPARNEWAWFAGARGECADKIRGIHWERTSLGPVEAWSPSLKSALATMIFARQPMLLWWGPELVQFYNDGFAPSLGEGRHQTAMGQRATECWRDAWPVVGAQIDAVITRGDSIFFENAPVPIIRNGNFVEAYWTYNYTPTFEADGTIAGVLTIVTETTARVLAQRRLRTLQQLGQALGDVTRSGDVGTAALSAMTAVREDAPWALIIRDSGGGDRVIVPDGAAPLAPSSALAQALQPIDRDKVSKIAISPGAGLPGTPWPEPVTHALALPFQPHSSRTSEWLVVGLSPRLVHDDSYEQFLLAARDQLVEASELLASQEARKVAERARNDLLMQAPVAAALLVGNEWRFEVANSLYVRMVGREVVGKAWHECFPELRGSPVDTILQRVFASGERHVAHEQMVPLARDGDGVLEDRFFDFNMIPIRSGEGVVDAMMVVAVEMTDQVHARRGLERVAVEREALVADLQRAAREKDDFLAMLGHELRNPLAPIVSALALMAARGDDDTRAEQAIITRQAKHMTRLVDDLLDSSRIALGKVELQRAVTDATTLVRNAVELVAALVEQRRHELTVKVDPDVSWHGDATRLEQVISNLLTNAARYTEPGGHISLSVAAVGTNLEIRVRDDGRGIEPKLLGRIFEPFVQGERGIDRRDGGLGLGLTVVKGLVTLHGGTVEARSEGVGKGSELVVTVPGVCDRASAPAAMERRIENRAGSRPKRVLVVDDNEDAANLLADVLRHYGHDVEVSYDGTSALALLDRFVPEVAFLDIGLPAMDGYELVGKMQSRAKSCRYIALTGYGQQADRDRAASAGFDRLVVKPVSTRSIQDLLQEAD